MTGKHTPGPWMVEMDANWPFDIKIKPNIVLMGRVAYSSKQNSLEDVRSAVGFPHDQREEVACLVAEQEANAHLIAAAPTMAEYIKRRADDGCEEAACIWEQINAR